MFGNQIRSEWQQEQQDDLRRGFITAPAAEESQRATVQPAHHKTGENTANGYFHKFDRRTANGEDHRPHRHCYGKLQRHQARGVIHQRFALQNAHDFFRDAPFANNPGERHSIGRRKHRRQRKGGDQRNARHHPVNKEANADHGDHHQRQREAENLSTMFEKFTGRRFPAISEQQRRDKQD